MTIVIPVWLLYVLGFLLIYFTFAACVLTNKGEQLSTLSQSFAYLRSAQGAIENKDSYSAAAFFKCYREYRQCILTTEYLLAFLLFPIILLDFYYMGLREGIDGNFGFLEIVLWPKTLIRSNTYIRDNLQSLDASEQKTILKLKEAGIKIDQ